MAKNPLPPDNTRSRAAFLRFPILFGSILGMFYVGFIYRKSFMTDLSEKKKDLTVNDPEGKALFRKSITEVNRERATKQE